MFRGRRRLSFHVFLLTIKGVYPKSPQTSLLSDWPVLYHMPIHAPITGNKNGTLHNCLGPIRIQFPKTLKSQSGMIISWVMESNQGFVSEAEGW